MVTFRLRPEFADAHHLQGPRELDCAGSTVHACIDEACRRADPHIADGLLEHEPGHRWRLREDADVRVNGKDVRALEGLGTPVSPEDVIEVREARLPQAAG